MSVRVVLSLLLVVLLAPVDARGADVKKAQEEVQAKLARERAALLALKDERVSMLDLLDVAERQSRAATARSRALEQELKALERRERIYGFLEQQAAIAQQAQLARLAPRLEVMYRRTRRHPLDVLLTATDFSNLLWRTRALEHLVAQDLRLLNGLTRADAYRRQAAEEMAALQGVTRHRLEAAKLQQSVASQQKAEWRDLLELVQAEASASSRLVAELASSERELSKVVTRLAAGRPTSGFGALRGRLPWPLEGGLVERGFGQVVNPKFNTVTLHKGIDVRVALGTPVRAVADGRVVHASWLRGYGNLLVLDHGGGYHTLMAHLDAFDREVGENVAAGEVVASVGESGSLKGPFLYFEVRERGDATDPAEWLIAR